MSKDECEHDYEWIDNSFDHDLGTQSQGYYECIHCGEAGYDNEPPSFECEEID